MFVIMTGALMTHGSDNITVKDTGILTTISIQV